LFFRRLERHGSFGVTRAAASPATVTAGGVGLDSARRMSHGEQLARPREVGGTVATGQQPVVADAMEALRQHVH